MHPTQFGAIHVFCYSSKSDFEELGPTLKAVISSVNVDAQFRYGERSLFARAAASITIPAVIGSGCAIAGLLLLRRGRKGKPNAPDGERVVRSSGAVWKIPLGLLLAIGHVSTLVHALDGDGWLQTTAEAQGYWFAWGLSFSVGLLLIYSGGRGLRTR